PLGEKRNHPGSKLRQGFWMVFRLGVNNWGKMFYQSQGLYLYSIYYISFISEQDLEFTRG
ncbi:hypothetical protein, partial [Streptococcus pneumoniae]|uniref:hypothetical protein n=1 Tax=Streptococcus pneumoniae TaxID=1313 RepID=UPI001D0232CA